MFQRRKKHHFLYKLKEFIWPSSGWVRASKYIIHRLFRMPGSTYHIASGLACGIAVSFTPFLGLHFIIAALLAWLIGGNLLASAVGTSIGNPWTFPFIWLSVYETGIFILGKKFDTLGGSFTLDNILANLSNIFWPMLVGGLLLAIVTWVGSYFIFYRLIVSYQNSRVLKKKITQTSQKISETIHNMHIPHPHISLQKKTKSKKKIKK